MALFINLLHTVSSLPLNTLRLMECWSMMQRKIHNSFSCRKSLHVTCMPLWMKLSYLCDCLFHTVCPCRLCVYRLQTGVSGRSFMLLCRYVDTTALLYFCVQENYTLLSIWSININIKDLIIANDMKSNWKSFKWKKKFTDSFNWIVQS